jgi:PAS domain-containing protein
MTAQSRRLALVSNPGSVRSQIPRARLRLAVLQRRSASLTAEESRVVLDALDDLELALHELDVTCAHSQELLEQRAAIEAEQERTHRRYQALFDGAPEPNIMTDLHGVIVEVNTAGSALLHVSSRWLRNKPLSLYVEDRALFAEVLRCNNESFVFSQPLDLVIRPRERARIRVRARVKRFEGPMGHSELWWAFGACGCA